MLELVSLTAAARGSDQDRVSTRQAGERALVALADGAGGQAGGAEAAERFVRLALEGLDHLDPVILLKRIDDALAADPSAGLAAGLVLVIDRGQLFGASVGDTGLHLFPPSGQSLELTEKQHRRPLLGSGEARPVDFRLDRTAGVLLAASDGLWKYAPLQELQRIATEDRPLEQIAEALVERVRLPTGELQDDVGLVLVRQRMVG